MFMHRITLRNILSFGPDAQELALKPLNVFIGPNGSGKSNLIDAIGLLQVASTDAAKRVRESGGVGDWIWRGEPKPRPRGSRSSRPIRLPPDYCGTVSSSPSRGKPS